MSRTAQVSGIPWRLENGGCAALPLPGDETIASVARAHVAGLLPAFGLSVQDVDDITLMVSELATNVLLHAMSDDGGPGAELWVYQRGDGQGHDELVVKAFDTFRLWRGRSDETGEMPEHGRGLEIIDILAGGRWGHHQTRSRLSTPAAQGKATWFALPIPRTRIARGRRPGGPADAVRAIKVLRSLLTQRGIDLRPADDRPDVHVLPRPETSGAHETLVWCQDETFRWRTHHGETGELPVTDITEVSERLVQIRAETG